MAEWLSKFFLSKVTATNAATVLLCIVLVLVVWPWLSSLSADRAIPENYSFPLAGLAMLTLSYLCVRVTVFFAKKVNQIFDRRQVQSKVQAHHHAFEENVRIALPALDKNILQLLSRLKEAEITVDLRGKGVSWLLQEKWISKVVRTSDTGFVAKINPSVKRLLSEYEQAELVKMISIAIDRLTDHQKAFLDIFWSDEIPYGTAESENMMSHQVYTAGQSLTQKGLLEFSQVTNSEATEENFSLTEEAEISLKERIFKTQPKRRVARISLRFVYASGSSGGGAPGGATRRF
ncbi:MAG: hypothetical protein GYB28_00060 [Gammaproteobacteria bacterium]|nr:hypothetical protein [Gammaproteobacteria bacterium]